MKLFVWDLHGTLEQGNEEAVIEISNMALAQCGFTARFGPEHARQLYGRKWYEYFAHLLPQEAHETHLQLQGVSFHLSDRRSDIIARHMRPTDQALEVLAVVQARHHQILISNTTPSSLRYFVQALGMENYFTPANCFPVNAHTKEAIRNKQDVLREYLATRPYDEIVVVGDSGSDMDLTQVAGGKGYLYAHRGLPFRSQKGDYKINELSVLLDEC